VPAEFETFKAAVLENAAASVKEPGCRQFDVLLYLRASVRQAFTKTALPNNVIRPRRHSYGGRFEGR
jgi:hypothetical protein